MALTKIDEAQRKAAGDLNQAANALAADAAQRIDGVIGRTPR